MMKKKYFILSLAFLLTACAKKKKLTPDELTIYTKELQSWSDNRTADLKAPDGWINLVGLYWLKPGVNTFGSDESNQIVFPKGSIPAKAGYFLLKENIVSVFPAKNVPLLSNASPIVSPIIFHPDSANALQIQYGSLQWTIIKREEKIGIRLRDLRSPALAAFAGVDRFPVNEEFRVDALLERGDSTKTIAITNVLGQTTAQPSPGSLVFTLHNREFRLATLPAGPGALFIIFADSTTGRETYGGGRFVYAKMPVADGKTSIDFNIAYNPPCVFTPYATCPLPPAQNILSIAITAGEKNYLEKL